MLTIAFERFAWFGALDRRLAELRHAVGTLLAKAAINEGFPLRAADLAYAMLRSDPLDEPAIELAVTALVAAGDRSEAARQWRQYVKRLDEEYGAAPSIDVSELLKGVASPA